MTLQQSRALLIVGHGSTVNPDSSAPTLAARRRDPAPRPFRRSGLLLLERRAESARRAVLVSATRSIREVYVVPNFISEGYFTQTVIPRELELTGRRTERSTGQLWKYCEPVGSHPTMTELLLQRAREVAPGVPEAETSLLIVGHGTSLNDNSAIAAKREVEAFGI